MKIKMISSEDKEEWLKETYKYLQNLKEDKYGDVGLDYIMLYELHEEEHKEIEKLKNELSIKTTYIEDLLKTILKSDDFKMQREVYEHGIEYDKKIKALKEGKENEKTIQKD